MNTFFAELAIRSLIVAVVGLLVRAALLRASANTRANVLALTMGALALLPIALIVLPRFQVTVAEQQVVDHGASAGVVMSNAVPQSSSPWLLVYVALALALVVRIAMSLVNFKQLERGMKPATPSLTERVLHFATRAREVFFSPVGEPPMTWGLIHPKIALPAESEEWIESQLQAVVLHEDAHIRRRDWAVMIGFSLVSAVYWYNPLVWVLKFLFEQDSERAADDFVLAQGVDAPDYAGRLVEVAKAMQGKKSLLPAVTMARSNRLNGRITAILDSKTKRGRLRGFAGISVVGILSIGAGSAALVLPTVKQTHIYPQVSVASNLRADSTMQELATQVDNPELDFNFDADQESNPRIPKTPKTTTKPKSVLTSSQPKSVKDKSVTVDFKGLNDLKNFDPDKLDVNINLSDINEAVQKGLAEADTEMKKAAKDSEAGFKEAEDEINRTDMPEAARKIAKASLAAAKGVTTKLLKGNKAFLNSRKSALNTSKITDPKVPKEPEQD